jgi:hypothetical protein
MWSDRHSRRANHMARRRRDARRLMVAVTLLAKSSGPAGADGENWLRSPMAVVSCQHSTSPCRISEYVGKSVGCSTPLLLRLAHAGQPCRHAYIAADMTGRPCRAAGSGQPLTIREVTIPFLVRPNWRIESHQGGCRSFGPTWAPGAPSGKGARAFLCDCTLSRRTQGEDFAQYRSYRHSRCRQHGGPRGHRTGSRKSAEGLQNSAAAPGQSDG